VRRWLDDLRHGARRLKRSPGFTVVAVATLAIGIGANVTIFGFASALLMAPLPVREPETLVRVFANRDSNVAPATLAAARERNRTLSGLAGFMVAPIALRTDGDAEPAFAMTVSGDYFGVLGVNAARGRLLAPADDDAGASGAVVLSDRFWRQRFGADASVVGRTVTINGATHVVVGVTPATFTGTMMPLSPDLWIPIHGPARMRERSVLTIGRLRPGTTLAEAQADMATIFGGLADAGRPPRGPVASVYPARVLAPEIQTSVQVFLGLLLALTGLTLLVTCVNLSSFQLTRAFTRAHEIGVRVALGAHRRHLLRLLLSESLLLATAGGLAAASAALLIGKSLARLPLPTPVPVALGFAFDGRVAAFAAGLSLAATVLFGLAPALAASRFDVVALLRHGLVPGARHSSRLRGALVTAQVALSTLLLVIGALFSRSLTSPRLSDRGFVTEGVVTATLDLESAGYTGERRAAFQETLLGRLDGAPGVETASFTDLLPLMLSRKNDVFDVEGHDADRPTPIDLQRITRGYFATLRIPLVAGRDFRSTDDRAATPVAIVNETLAHRFWPGANPLGRHLRALSAPGAGAQPWIEVVGVARDSKYVSVSEEPRPFLYRPVSQQSGRDPVTLIVRTNGDAQAALPAVRAHVRALDPNVPLFGTTSLESATSLSVLVLRVVSGVAVGLGTMALLLVLLGMYGLMSHAVLQRTREIGIRMAIGASPAHLLRALTHQGLRWTAVGLLLGLAAAAAVARVLPYGVNAGDPVSFAAVALVLGVVGWLACWLPARRAIAANPVGALRGE
jgi:predicted permease